MSEKPVVPNCLAEGDHRPSDADLINTSPYRHDFYADLSGWRL